jgi:hypothetical protein
MQGFVILLCTVLGANKSKGWKEERLRIFGPTFERLRRYVFWALRRLEETMENCNFSLQNNCRDFIYSSLHLCFGKDPLIVSIEQSWIRIRALIALSAGPSKSGVIRQNPDNASWAVHSAVYSKALFCSEVLDSESVLGLGNPMACQVDEIGGKLFNK